MCSSGVEVEEGGRLFRAQDGFAKKTDTLASSFCRLKPLHEVIEVCPYKSHVGLPFSYPRPRSHPCGELSVGDVW